MADLAEFEPWPAELVLEDAKHGRLKALVKLLRARAERNRPLQPEILLFIADFLEGKRPKRTVGYVSKTDIRPSKHGPSAWLIDLPWSAAAARVDEYKKLWKTRYGVHERALSKAAADFGICEKTLGDYIKRGRTRRGRASGS
jgi:hypothetical protein